jgi:molybdate transport system ATP-binding protein
MCADQLHIDARITLPDFDLSITESMDLDGVTAIFGPSGSGKSTLLRTIAGFEQPQSGTINCAGQLWYDSEQGVNVPPHHRSVGYMFQDARLFSHLDVDGNLRYAEKRRGQLQSRRGSLGSRRGASENLTYAHVVDVLDIGTLLKRSVTALSGGERQRVALARTLLTAPQLLLLDEPLSALDQARKEDILPYLENLQREFGIPTLYVSHDISEVAHLADRMVVLANGSVKAQGPTPEMLERFDLETYTGRFEAGVLVEGEVSGHDNRLHLTRVDLHGASLTIPMAAEAEIGKRVRLRIRARDVAIATQPPQGLSIRNVLPGTLVKIVTEPDNGSAQTIIDVGGPRIRARLTMAAVEDLKLREGLSVYALIKSISLDSLGSS